MSRPFIFKEGILEGKTAVITGGASGIGFGIARRLAMGGANIVIASRRIELCQEKANELASDFGVKTHAVALDVRDSSNVNACYKEAADVMGGIDISINNAAGNFYFPAAKLRDKLWSAVIDIDLNGTFYCSRAAHKHMKDKGGLIVSISMTLHHFGWVGMAPACAAKSGIDALTRTLALEWGHKGIRVNAIAPGPIVTEGVSKAFEMGGDFARQEDSIPLGRTGDVEEIGDMVVFLAAPTGEWITGEIIVMDGGHKLADNRGGIPPEKIDTLLKDRVKK